MNHKSVERELDKIAMLQGMTGDLAMERMRGYHINETLERRAIDAKISSLLRKKKE
jgi:hypothetical protein